MTDFPPVERRKLRYVCVDCGAPWSADHVNECPRAQPPNVRVLKPTVDQDVVQMLEETLAMAKSGEIRAVAIAAVRHGKETSTSFVIERAESAMKLLGAMSHLSYRISRRLDPAEGGE